jgi:4,5-dihydroxyphthalate decarboxylase
MEYEMKLTVGRDDLALAAVAGVESAGVSAERVIVEPVHNAADGFVNDGDTDICEVPIVTLLQAVALGRPVLLLPVTTLGRHQHQTLVTMGDLTVDDLEGRTVGVRSWSQTTGVWVRGVLAEQYDVDLRKVNWQVYESSHVAGHQDPDWIKRAPDGRKLPADFLAREVDFGIMGNDLPKADGIRTVLPHPDAAAAAWSQANGFTPVNHVIGVTEQAAREHPGAVLAAYDALAGAARAAAAAKPGSGAFHPTGFAGLRGPAGRAAKYAGEQLVAARPVEFDELVERTCSALGVPPSRLGG